MDVHEITLLIDFYGQLLTDRQLEALDLHYNNDYSLGEIAIELNISRQGVFDSIKRGKLLLYSFEEKLGLVDRFIKQQDNNSHILRLIDNIDVSLLNDTNKQSLDKIKDIVTSMINE